MDGVLGTEHFDEAMKTARKSVSKTELARFLKFKKDLSGGGGIKQARAAAEEDDARSVAPDVGAAAAESDEELYD